MSTSGRRLAVTHRLGAAPEWGEADVFRAILETTHEGVWVIDSEARTVLVNESMAKLLGETVEGMLGRTMFEFMDASARTAAEIRFMDRKRGIAEHHEFTLTRRDGKALVTMMATNPLYDDTGRFRGALAIVSDISAQKRQQRALELLAVGTAAGTGNTFFEALVVNLASILGTDFAFIGALTSDGNRVESVACADRGTLLELFDYELSGTPCADTLVRGVCTFRADVQSLFPEDAMLEDFGIQAYVGTPLERADGTRFGILFAAHRAPLAENVVFDLEALMRLCANRVSAELERMQAEQALRKSEAQLAQSQRMEAVGRLAGGVAHDFNNLLMAILGNVDLALDPSHDLLDPCSALREVRAAALRAADLTRQLLAFSRKQIIHTTNVDVHKIIVDTKRMLERMLGEDVRIETELAELPAIVCGDVGQIQRVLVNLAVNARDAMPRGGALRFRTRVRELCSPPATSADAFVPGDYVHVEVVDTGSGMDADTLAHAFEPFYTTKGMGQGTGLGLASSHGIITQLGGFIWAESEVGEGTVMHFVLPLVGGASTKRESDHPSAAPPAAGPATILVVEDEAAVRALIERAVLAAGYTVISATDGSDAIKRLESHRGGIDLVLCDIVMPGMRGGEVVLRVLERYPDAAVIFMSGYPDVLERSPGIPADAEIVTKPFTLEQIVTRIAKALEQRSETG